MKALLLAGGKGTRLWPLSRSRFPKQFLKIDGKHSLLQKSYLRLLSIVNPSNLFIVTNRDYYLQVVSQLKELDVESSENILIEPIYKNTAFAIAWAIEKISKKQQSNESVFFFITPADHLISPTQAFEKTVQKALLFAKEKKGLITFGVRPTHPETGYGYLKTLENGKVEQFIEKPSLAKAQSFLSAGNYFWNSGMFLFSAEVFINEMKAHSPSIWEAAVNQENLESIPSLSIDYAIMERSKNVWTIPLDLQWSDVGNWENVYETLEKDEKANSIQGDVLLKDTSNSLIASTHRKVVTLGIDSLVIIETDDVVFIAKKGESQKVKEIVEILNAEKSKLVEEHATVYRPWGSYTVLEEGRRYKIKRIVVHPCEKLSLQLHYHRSEHWVIVKGTAKVTIGSEESIVHEGESIFVPKSSIHRVENPGKVPLEIIEVQVGEYLGEDDIVRLEDVYGRLKEDEAFNILLKNRSSL